MNFVQYGIKLILELCKTGKTEGKEMKKNLERTAFYGNKSGFLWRKSGRGEEKPADKS